MRFKFEEYTDDELLDAKDKIEEELNKRKTEYVAQAFMGLRRYILELMALDVKISIVPAKPCQGEYVIRPTTTETISIPGYNLSFSTDGI